MRRQSLIIVLALSLLVLSAMPAGAGGWTLVWDPFEQPMPAEDDGDHPDVAVALDQTVHVIWAGWHNDDYNVWMATRRPPAGPWSAPISVAPPNPGESYPEFARLAVGADGAAHAVWEDWLSGVYYASRPAGGAWSAPEQISEGGAQVSQPALALNLSDNRRFAVWEQEIGYTPFFTSYSAIYFSTRAGDGGGWEIPVNISSPTRNAISPDVTTDASGALHVVWIAELQNDTPQVFYRRRAPTGAWGPIRQVRRSAAPCETPSVSVDPLFRLPVVAWSEEVDASLDVFCATQYSDGQWSLAANVSNSAALSRNPDTLVLADGRIVMVWLERVQSADESEADGLLYAHRERFAEDWSAPAEIIPPTVGRSLSAPRWALDQAGDVHLVWAAWQEGERVQIWYARGRAGEIPPAGWRYALPLIVVRR